MCCDQVPIEGANLYGRGSWEMKSGLAAMIGDNESGEFSAYIETLGRRAAGGPF